MRGAIISGSCGASLLWLTLGACGGSDEVASKNDSAKASTAPQDASSGGGDSEGNDSEGGDSQGGDKAEAEDSERSAGSGPMEESLDGDVDAGTAMVSEPAAAESPASEGWGPAVRIADSSGPFSVNAAIDVNGNAVAAWTDLFDELEGVYASYYDAAAGTWAPATLVERADRPVRAVAPQVGLDARGNAMILWHRETSDLVSSEIWGNRYDVETRAWAGAERVSSGNGALAELVVDPSGDATGLWATFDGLSISLLASAYDGQTGKWSEAEAFEQGSVAGTSIIPIVASAPGGAAVVTWTEGDLFAGALTAQARRWVAGAGSWNSAEEVARDTTFIGNASLIATGAAVNDAGSAFVVWEDAEQDQVVTAWVNRYDEKLDAWSGGERLGHQDMELAYLPQVAVDPMGNAMAVWAAVADERLQVWVKRYRAAEDRWEAAEVLASDSEASCTHPQIGLDEVGNATLVWTKKGDDGETLWSNRYDVAKESWGAATPLDLGDLSEGTEPWLSLAPNGEAVLVWISWEGGVYANHYRP